MSEAKPQAFPPIYVAVSEFGTGKSTDITASMVPPAMCQSIRFYSAAEVDAMRAEDLRDLDFAGELVKKISRVSAQRLFALEAAEQEIARLREALEKIADPRKRDHKEPDAQTEVYCLMNIANESLASQPSPKEPDASPT